MIFGGIMDRKFLSISSISMLGSCETKFLETIQGRKPTTPAMKAGTVAHEKVAEALPKITKEEIIGDIKAGKQIKVRELPVYNSKMNICGRIDQLDMTGRIENGKNTGIIIDDKYPSSTSRIYGLTLYYKLQLSSYAVALDDSDAYGNICKAIGAQLIYRERGSNTILQHYEITRPRLEVCTANVGIAIKDAWNLYQGKAKPEHRRFDVESAEWIRCYCQHDANKIPNQARLYSK